MNALVIEQSPEETRAASALIPNVAINRIRLVRARLVSEKLEAAAEAPVAVTFHFKSKPVAAPSHVLRLEIAFRMVGTVKTKAAVRVEAAFEVDYVLNEGFSPAPQQIKAFKDGNAIFNAWPYFREYLQESLLRMGLPLVTAPFLRLQPKLAKGRGESSGEPTPAVRGSRRPARRSKTPATRRS